ncbi:MAG TPA: HlyD family secretion protein [Drouetiella sp.]
MRNSALIESVTDTKVSGANLHAVDGEASKAAITIVDRASEANAQSDLPTKQKGKRSNKKMIIGVAASILLLAGSIGGAASLNYMSTHEGTDDAYVDGNITQISSRVNGNVSKVLVDDNQYVKAGQVLVSLDPRDYDVKVEQAKAALEKAQRQAQADTADVVVSNTTAGAQSDTAASDISRANATIAAAKSMVTNAQAALGMEKAKLASMQVQENEFKLDMDRYANLSAQGAVSKQQYDQARTQYEVQAAQVAAENQAIQQATANVGKTSADLQQAFSDLSKTKATIKNAQAAQQTTNVKSYLSDVSKATVDQAKADLQNALLQRSYCDIVAPVSGRVGKKSVHSGEQIQLGQGLFTIIPDDTWLTANFKETQIGNMRPGQKVEISVDAFPGTKFIGRIDSLAPASGAKFALLPADNATGNFTKVVQRVPVKIVFDQNSVANLKQLITPGLSAEVTVDLAKS